MSFGCSVVIPFYNEAHGAPRVLGELAEALAALPEPAEVLLIDDGSTDGTRATLENACWARPGWRVLIHEQNRGQAAALLKGLHAATAPILVTMDGDGQNDPADLAAMLELVKSGRADLVAGVRVERNDSTLRRLMSRLANAVRQRVLHDGVRDTGCALKVFRREVVEAFLPIRTLYSFMPALAAAAGFRVVEQPVRHRARQADESKYGLGVMLWRPLVDMVGVWWFMRRRLALEPPKELSPK